MKKIIVAGIGNILFGDDGFGVAVANRLLSGPASEAAGATVLDVGIRGIDLAYRLLDPVDLLIVVDLVTRGGSPGTLYVIEPTPETLGAQAAVNAHGMNLQAIFDRVRLMGATPPRTIIVGCEPAQIEECMGLSETVSAMIAPAIELIKKLIARAHEDDIQPGNQPGNQPERTAHP